MTEIRWNAAGPRWERADSDAGSALGTIVFLVFLIWTAALSALLTLRAVPPTAEPAQP